MTTENTNPLLIDIPMPIVTPRLILRPPQAGDGPTLYDVKGETWDDLTRWMPWAKERGTVADDEAVARELGIKFQKREDITLFGFARDDGRFIMACGLHRYCWEKRRFEIGYWVRASEHGNGYAPEAANALTRYAFAVLKAKATAIEYAEGNDRSRRVIEKLGYEKEGVARMDVILPDGTQTHRHIYSRLNTDGLPELKVSWG